MTYLWAEVQDTQSGYRAGFKAHLVMAKDSRGRTGIVFRSLFKHHCLRVSKFINCNPASVTQDQIDEAAFNIEYDKSVEEIIDGRLLRVADLCSSLIGQLQTDDKVSMEEVSTV